MSRQHLETGAIIVYCSYYLPLSEDVGNRINNPLALATPHSNTGGLAETYHYVYCLLHDPKRVHQK